MGDKGAESGERSNFKKECINYRMHGVLPCSTTCENGEEGR